MKRCEKCKEEIEDEYLCEDCQHEFDSKDLEDQLDELLK